MLSVSMLTVKAHSTLCLVRRLTVSREFLISAVAMVFLCQPVAAQEGIAYPKPATTGIEYAVLETVNVQDKVATAIITKEQLSYLERPLDPRELPNTPRVNRVITSLRLMLRVSLAEGQVFDTTRAKLTAEQIVRRVKPGMVVLIAPDEKMLDAAAREPVGIGTIILVAPVPSFPAGRSPRLAIVSRIDYTRKIGEANYSNEQVATELSIRPMRDDDGKQRRTVDLTTIVKVDAPMVVFNLAPGRVVDAGGTTLTAAQIADRIKPSVAVVVIRAGQMMDAAYLRSLAKETPIVEALATFTPDDHPPRPANESPMPATEPPSLLPK